MADAAFVGRDHCFAKCATCNLHTRGSWQPSSTAPPYRLNHSLWNSLGLSGPPASSSQHYGLCDDRASKLGTRRQLYEWQPDACDLPSFDRARACSLLRGRQLVVVGDSTAGQLFLSLVLLLGGRFGRNSRHTSAISDITASACDGTCRLNFIRNDLLLWSTHRSEFNRARECDKLLKADAFVQRVVRDAHLLVIATGHHFPASIESAAAANGGQPGAAFFASSLNHTLSHLMRLRAQWGHHPRSVSLMVRSRGLESMSDPCQHACSHRAASVSRVPQGASVPIPRCSHFARPLGPEGWLVADSSMANSNKYSPRWRLMPRVNLQLQWLAASYVHIHLRRLVASNGSPLAFLGSLGTIQCHATCCLHPCLPPASTAVTILASSILARHRPGGPTG